MSSSSPTQHIPSKSKVIPWSPHDVSTTPEICQAWVFEEGKEKGILGDSSEYASPDCFIRRY